MSVQAVVRAGSCAALFMILPAFAFAQQVGVKAGINFASLTPEEDEDPDTSLHLGPIGGLWFGTPLTSRVSLQVEGLFSEKGVKFDFRAIGFGESDVRIRYLEIPVLARSDFGAPGASSRVFVVGGAAPAFELAARARAEFEGEVQTLDIADDVKPFDLGLVGGIGVAFGPASIEARYTLGLLHINEDDNGDDRIRNRVFSVMVGFRLR